MKIFYFCNISCENLIDFKPLPIKFNKIDGFIRLCDGTRYLVLFGSEKYDSFYNRIRYLISVKSGITYKIFHNYAKTFHDVIILAKSVFNKD